MTVMKTRVDMWLETHAVHSKNNSASTFSGDVI